MPDAQRGKDGETTKAEDQRDKKASHDFFQTKGARSSRAFVFLNVWLALAAPDIDSCEKEQPDNINEVPIPGGGFEAHVTLWSEVASA